MDTTLKWTSDWDTFYLMFTDGNNAIKQWMQTQAETPAELTLLPSRSLATLYQSGFMKRATFERMMMAFNNWGIIQTLLNLTHNQTEQLYAINFEPSDLIENKNALDDVQLKPATKRRIIMLAQKLFGIDENQYHYDYDDQLALNAKQITQFPFALNTLFSAIHPFAIHEIFTSDQLIDVTLTRVTVGGLHIADVLDAIHDKSHISALEFNLGWISDLAPLIARIHDFPNVVLLDLSTNRIGVDQFNNMKLLSAAMALCNGACIIHGNPILSRDGITQFIQFATDATLTKDDLASLLHLIGSLKHGFMIH